KIPDQILSRHTTWGRVLIFATCTGPGDLGADHVFGPYLPIFRVLPLRIRSSRRMGIDPLGDNGPTCTHCMVLYLKKVWDPHPKNRISAMGTLGKQQSS